ncbi:hypothetical protein H8356DRAFT_1717643 [Neocallimastix lanati (nom. inval.)]|nr:hypothetical protein H8356DRAFT_1717643 [Neocallimastix sp. JGI-2020a]
MTSISLANYKQVCSSTKIGSCKSFYKELLKYFSVGSAVPQFSEIFQTFKFKYIMNSLPSKCF